MKAQPIPVSFGNEPVKVADPCKCDICQETPELVRHRKAISKAVDVAAQICAHSRMMRERAGLTPHSP